MDTNDWCITKPRILGPRFSFIPNQTFIFQRLDKDKEALLNVAYNVTDNISSRAILQHNNIFNRYLPFTMESTPDPVDPGRVDQRLT